MHSPIQRLREAALPTNQSTALIDQSLEKLQGLLRSGTLKPSELLEAHIERIAYVNPHLHALIADRYTEARQEASAADAQQASTPPESLPPLFGIPCTIKEFFAVTGMPHTGGLLKRREQRATEDAEAVRRLRKAGAIVLGVTNVPEGGLWLETNNKIHGRTNNPWNLARTPGGSSGGEGAIVAAGGSVFGLGSDIGGSIRIPAAFCGVVGHKPSAGLVPLTGHYPPGVGDLGYCVGGPLCRRVEDVMPILRSLVGPDGVDESAERAAREGVTLRDPAQVALHKLVVFPVLNQGPRRASCMSAAVDESCQVLREAGATVGTLRIPELRHSFRFWMAAIRSITTLRYEMVLSDGAGISVLGELLRAPFGRAGYVLPSLVTVASEKLMYALPISEQRWLDRLRRVSSELDSALGDNGVLIVPPYSRPAPPHGQPLLTPFDTGLTGLYNVLGYASTVVPLGFDDEGLPVAVQVVSRRGNDHLCLAAAAALQNTFGGWVRAEPAP